VVGQADAGTTADSSQLKPTQRGPVAQRVMPQCQRQSLTAILPDRLHHTHSCAKASPQGSSQLTRLQALAGRTATQPTPAQASHRPYFCGAALIGGPFVGEQPAIT
jgi:hypothetical protein